MNSAQKSEDNASGDASLSRLVFLANGAIALAILGFLSAREVGGNPWLFVGLVIASVGAVFSLIDLLSIRFFPSEMVDLDKLVESLVETGKEITDAHATITERLAQSHYENRENDEWWEDKIAMLSYALREGGLKEESADEVRDALAEFRSSFDEIHSEGVAIQIELARAADELNKDKIKVQNAIEKNVWRRKGFESVFYHSGVIGRLCFLSALVVGLIGIKVSL